MPVTANNRIFYACQAVGFKNYGHAATEYIIAKGVQSVGITYINPAKICIPTYGHNFGDLKTA